MKKIILILIFLILKPNLGVGQQGTYQPIPGSNVHWREFAFWTVWLPAPTPVYDDYSLFIPGDTVIGSYTYHKLHKNGQTSSTSPPSISYTNQYVGAFRQDSLLQKVFIIIAPDTTEQLLYDFSLNAGDTLAVSYNNDITNPTTNGNYVLAVDSVFVGTNLHKRLLLSPVIGSFNTPDTNYAIIEGVGSTFGFYHLIEPLFERGSQLNCFTHDISSYPPTLICPFYLDLQEIESSSNLLSIVPNPGVEMITLSLKYTMINGRLLLHNYLGKVIEETSGLNGSTVLINKGVKPPGMYFITIEDKGQILATGKIVFLD